MTNGLNTQQERFCHEYLVDFQGGPAARRAGYSETSCRVTACRLMSMPAVQAKIAELASKGAKKADISAEMVLDGIRSIAINPDAKHSDQLKAWELLGKYLKLFVDRQEVDIKAEVHLIMLTDIRQHNAQPSGE